MSQKKPLEGVRVVDFSMYAATPCCGRMLAYLGADVVKVEPVTGDIYRYMGSMIKSSATDEEAPGYDLENVGKRSLAVNLKSEEAAQIVHKLIAGADIMITNYREGALKKLKLEYDDLKKINPRLVYGLVDGFGEKGPEAGRPGYDTASFMARSGILGDFVEPDAPPLNPMGAMGDHATGVALTAGVLGAYVGALRTGKGDKVLASLYHGGIWAVSSLLIGTQYGDTYPKSRYNPVVTPITHTYQCKDGEWVMLGALDMSKHWPALCKAMEREDLLKEEKYNSMSNQIKNQKELIPVLEGIIEQKPFAEWAKRFVQFDVPHEKVGHVKDIAHDEQALVNNFIRPITYPSSGKTVYIATPPFKLQEAGEEDVKEAPKTGEHTVEILGELGYSPEEIETLKTQKVVRAK